MNPYTLSNLTGVDHRLIRVLQDMTDRINFLGREGESAKLTPSVDAARRENPAEGIITVPCKGTGGQDGSIRVNRDGVIVSYINPVSDPNFFSMVKILGGEVGTSVANTTTETSVFPFVTSPVGSRTITGQMAKLGVTFHIHLYGRIQTTLTPTLTIRVKFTNTIGTTTLVTVTGTLTVATTGMWEFDCPIFIRPGGVGVNNARFMYPAAGVMQQLGASAGTNVNTFIPNLLDITIQWGTASVSNVLDADAIYVTMA